MRSCQASPEAHQAGTGTPNALTDPKARCGVTILSVISEGAKVEGGLDLITVCRLFTSMNGKKGGKEMGRNY